MTPKRAHFFWLVRKAQAAAQAGRLVPLLLLSVFIVLSSASNTLAQVGWSTPMPSWDGPAPATSVADRCFTGNLNGDRSNPDGDRDRKSTRLNSSHLVISYAVFCLKKKII